MSSNPVYLGFVNFLKRRLDENGIKYHKDPNTASGVVENANFVNFQFDAPGGGMHKVYVPKNVGTMGPVQTTFAFDPKVPGVRPLPATKKRPQYKNGAIRSHLDPDREQVARLIIQALRDGLPVPQKRVGGRQQNMEAKPSDEAAGGQAQPTTHELDIDMYVPRS